METNHLGAPENPMVHPVVASAAREVLNKSENERSGVLSTAMSFLGLYRDPVVAETTSACDWRIADLVDAAAPVSLYLVIPPSDISRTKPLVRLILNQIGRRLTERLEGDPKKSRRHELLMMLDEFPALGRLDFFETALAFMAGYGIRAYLIAQSLNQISKAYGENNAILDNCHVRIAFSSNDERTAKRIGVSTVHTILRNRIYTGAFEWLDKVYQGSHAPLVSEDLWGAVQDVLDGRKAANIRASVNDFPFTGMMTCGHCGCAMVAEIKKQRYIYYHCTGFKGKCGEPYVREEVLEQRFAGLLRQLRFDDAAFELIQRALRESLQDETRERRAAIERLRGEADRLQARIERMYEDKLDGVISDDFYRRMQIVWREERDRCLKDIERHHSADDEYIDNGIALIRLGREAHDLFERASASEKRRVLNLVLSNCSWAHGELTTKFRQPFDLLSETIAQSTLPEKGETGDLPENEKWLRG